MRISVPAIACTEPLLEQVLLVSDTGVLVERTEVPEHPDVFQAPACKVLLEDGSHDPEVETLGIRMTLRTMSKVSCGRVSRHTHAKAHQHTGENGLAMFCNLFEDEIVASLFTLAARRALPDLENAQLHKPSRQDACSVRMQRLYARPCGNVSRIPTTLCVLSRDVKLE